MSTCQVNQEPSTKVRQKQQSLISTFITENFTLTLSKRFVKALYLNIISTLFALYKTLHLDRAFNKPL